MLQACCVTRWWSLVVVVVGVMAPVGNHWGIISRYKINLLVNKIKGGKKRTYLHRPKQHIVWAIGMTQVGWLCPCHVAGLPHHQHCKTSGVRFSSILGMKVGFLTIKVWIQGGWIWDEFPLPCFQHQNGWYSVDFFFINQEEEILITLGDEFWGMLFIHLQGMNLQLHITKDGIDWDP